MAFTEGDKPTGGPSGVDRFMIDPTIPDDDDKFDKALEAAFGPQGNKSSDKGGDGEGGTVDADTTSDGTTPPDPTSTVPDVGASAEGEEEGSEEGGQTSGAIGGDAADFAALFRNRYGRDPEPGELEGYIALAEWAAQLTPEQQGAINRALENPDLYIAPQQQQQQTPTPDPTPDPLEEEFGADHPLVQRIRQLEASQQQVTSQSLQQQQERLLADIDKGVKTFHSRYEDLTPEELEQLQGAVARSRIFPGFVQANNGDAIRGMEAALDYAYWQTPAFRQREIEKQYAAMEEQKKAEATRKAKASSVTGSGGNGASRTTPPPKTNEDRWAAVAAGIGEAMNGQQE